MKAKKLTPCEWVILAESEKIHGEFANAKTDEEKSAALTLWNEFAHIEGKRLHLTTASERHWRN